MSYFGFRWGAAAEEYFISRGTLHGGEVVAGTRTIHAFGGKRAEAPKPSLRIRGPSLT